MRTIQFVAGDKKRRSIRLGQVTQKVAESIRTRVEALHVAILSRTPLDSETAAWVGQVGDDLRSKLQAVGLVEARVKKDAIPTIAEHIKAYIARRTDAKPRALINLRRAESMLIEFIGTEKRLDEFTKGDARDWLRSVKERYADATIARVMKRGKEFFANAIEHHLLVENPFKGIKIPKQVNKSREHFIDAETARKVIAKGTDAEWRLVVAPARFGGLRIPSELLP